MRLTQQNESAALPLLEKELLMAWATQTLPDRTWCVIRMRIATSGHAERSVHVHGGPERLAFHHEWVVLPGGAVSAIIDSARAAHDERAALPDPEPDPQTLYRRITFRADGDVQKTLLVEYRDGVAVGPAAGFEATWHLLASYFSTSRMEHGSMAALAW